VRLVDDFLFVGIRLHNLQKIEAQDIWFLWLMHEAASRQF
jgi:hypothetical protein